MKLAYKEIEYKMGSKVLNFGILLELEVPYIW